MPEAKNNQDLLLAIDNGTQSVRALAFNLRGDLVAKAQVPLLERYRHPHPRWMELDPEEFWRAVCSACAQLWAPGLVRPAQLRGLVVTTQRATVISLDAQCKPLRPAIVWADQRRSRPRGRLPWYWELAFRAIGLRDTIASFEQEAECNWLAQHEAELWARTDKFVLLSGWLNLRLTGRCADAVGSQVGYLPFDYKRHRWAGAFDWKWHVLAVRPHMLPELVPSASVLGEVSAAAAADTGLPVGLPVIAGATDKACEVLGAGALTPDIGCLSFGTAATVNTTMPRYVETLPFIPPYPAAIPGHFNNEVMIARGFWMVSWFAEQFGGAERRRAALHGKSPEAYFDELVGATPPGAQGLMLQPYWNPGVRIPGPEARGAVIGFTDQHTRAHLYRAIIEGLAYALREGKERLERRNKVPITQLRVAGGGSQSDAVLGITADIFNLPAERTALAEASGLGAAMLAAVGLKLHRSFEVALAEMVRPGRVFEPNATNARLYEQLYRVVYLGMYKRLKPLYDQMHGLAARMPTAPGAAAASREP
jgi:sugar (pentulose or hexulose) kinase